MNPLTAATHAAARKLLNLQMTDIQGEPTKADALALIDDLRAIWTIIDPLIETYGRYARSTLGVSQHDVETCFVAQLEKALDGNATFCIEAAIDRLIEDRLLDEADYRFDERREAV